MNHRQQRILADEALYIAQVILSEVRLSEQDAEAVRRAIFTALYSLESRDGRARLFVAHHRAQMPTAWVAELLESFKRLVEMVGLLPRVVSWLGGRTTWA